MATDALLLLGIAVPGRVRGLLLVGVAALAIARAAGKVARPSWIAALHPLQHVPGLLLPLAVSRRLLDDLPAAAAASAADSVPE